MYLRVIIASLWLKKGKREQGVINNVRFIVGVGGTTHGGVQLVLSRTNRIGDIEYYIYCSRLEIWISKLISQKGENATKHFMVWEWIVVCRSFEL